MQLLLTRLQDAAKSDVAKSGLLGNGVVDTPGCKNPQFVRGLLVLLCRYASAHGGAAAYRLLDDVQPGLFAQVSAFACICVCVCVCVCLCLCACVYLSPSPH
jgi:hypothetical protein